jgi:acetyl-CoA acetyltransferase
MGSSSDIWIIGSYSTEFGRKPDTSLKQLTRETYLGVIEDAGIGNGDDIGSAWFGNCLMHTWGQGGIRGQACFIELVDEGLFPARVPMTNVEGACATASMALQGAIKDIRSGEVNVSLAVGVEKIYRPGADKDPAIRQVMFDSYYSGVDNFDLDRLFAEYEGAAQFAGCQFEKGEGHTIFMETYGIQAALHMKLHGTTQRQIAAGAAKSHNYAVNNPKAQYRFPMTIDQVMEDRAISYPLTRSMCAPIGDGGASAVVCNDDYLKSLPPHVRDRAIRVAATALTGGKYRTYEEPSLAHYAALKAYRTAGITAHDVDVAEVHDATAFCEIYQAEMLGFCPIGMGGAFVESGETGPGGSIPINTSGGLISKGHPVGATGLSMVYELVTQLRGEAGERQVPNARIGLAENGGGVIGLEEAACAITILERP